MRRVTYAAGFVVVLLLVGAFLFPRMQGNAAIAGVMRAMANVKSCHMTGWTFDKDGRKVDMEGWFKAPDRMRMRHGDSYDYFQKGDKAVTIEDGRATIELAEDTGGGVMAMLSADFLRRLAAGEGISLDVDRTTLPDGREALVLTGYERQKYYTGTVVFTIDKATDLMVSFKQYDKNHHLTSEISRIEYDVEVPDSAFVQEVPKGMPVVDLITPPTPEQLKWRQEEKQRLIQANAEVAISISKGSDEIRGYRFECIRTGGLLVFYIPDQDVYRVLGSVLVEGPEGFLQTVEDGDIRLPDDPQVPAPMPYCPPAAK